MNESGIDIHSQTVQIHKIQPQSDSVIQIQRFIYSLSQKNIHQHNKYKSIHHGQLQPEYEPKFKLLAINDRYKLLFRQQW